MKICKVGNTTLKFNESRAVKTQEEIDEILHKVYTDARNSIIEAAVKKEMEGAANTA